MKKSAKLWIMSMILVTLVCMTVFHYGIHRMNEIPEIPPETYERHYALITNEDDGNFWDKVYESAYEAGKENGVYVERFGSQLAVDYTRNELIKLAIQASVDGIILQGDEEQETMELLNQAVEAGIPVVTMLTDSPGSLRQCFVGMNNYNLGQEYGKQVAAILKEKLEDADNPARVLVLMDEDRKDSSQNLILLGIRETMKQLLGKDYPVTVETKQIDSAGSLRSEESIRDIFLNWSVLPDIMICFNEVNTRCVFQATVDYNVVGNVQILGYYDSETILDAVAKNIVYATIAPDTKQMGEDCVTALEEYLNTGYTNGYMAVDAALIKSGEAVERLNEK